MSDRVNFDQAAALLGMTTEELQGLVSNQEIRAEHDGGEVFFREEDIEAFQKSRSTEPTVVLSESTEALVDEGDGVVLEDLSTEETVLNIEGLLEDDGAGILEGETELELGDVGDDTVLDTDELVLDDSFDFSDDETVGGTAGDDMLLTGTTEMQLVRKRPSTAMTVALALTLLILLVPAAVLLNLINGDGAFPEWASDSTVSFMNGLVEAVVGAF
ncbi:MAG: helix-turn-helix domain-containing protein [Planctomycetota bacterium]|nr:helix-turn-helix domain-containing protein [Planctomycetota bacterium]